MPRRSGTFGAIGAIFLWAAGNLIVRDAPMPGAQIAFWRLTLGAVVFLALLAINGRRLTWRQIRLTTPAASAIGLELVVFFVAIKNTTVANATILGALQPLVVIGFGIRRFGEHITRRLVGVTIVAIVGVALVVFGSTAQPVWSPRGDVLALLAMILFSAYLIFAKQAREEVPALEFQTALWLVGGLVVFPVAVIDAGGVVLPSLEQWIWLAALLAVPGTGHFVMNWAHGRTKLSLASLLTLGIPVLSAAGAALLLDEPLVVVQIIGMAIVLGSLAVAVMRDASRDDIEPDIIAAEIP